MRTLAFLSVLVLSACATSSAPGSAALDGAVASAAGQGAGRPADTLARIHALVGKPSCTADSQCRSLPIGARPCGGPEAYLAYSTAHTPEAELRALGDLYRAERQGANTRAGRVSDCNFIPDPGAVCKAGACQTGAGLPMAR